MVELVLGFGLKMTDAIFEPLEAEVSVEGNGSWVVYQRLPVTSENDFDGFRKRKLAITVSGLNASKIRSF